MFYCEINTILIHNILIHISKEITPTNNIMKSSIRTKIIKINSWVKKSQIKHVLPILRPLRAKMKKKSKILSFTLHLYIKYIFLHGIKFTAQIYCTYSFVL